LDIPVDADGLNGDDNNSTGTFQTNCSAATAVTVENTKNTDYSDDHSGLSALMGNLSIKESRKKKDKQRMVQETTKSVATDNRPEDKQDE
jgi:hypothetical protein